MAIFTGDIYHILENLRKDCPMALMAAQPILIRFFLVVVVTKKEIVTFWYWYCIYIQMNFIAGKKKTYVRTTINQKEMVYQQSFKFVV